MDRASLRRLCIGAACLGGAALLAACNGDGSGGSVAVAPTPTPTPTPTPSPTPTPTPSPTPTPLAGAPAVDHVGDFAVLGSAETFSADRSSNIIEGTRKVREGEIAFRHPAAGAPYEIRIPDHDFGTIGSTVTQDYIFSSSKVTVPPSPTPFSFYLMLSVPGDRSALLSLAYSGVGSWAHGEAQTGNPDVYDHNYGSFAYGVSTPLSALPASGTRKYRGFVFDPYMVSGPLALTVDFATGKVSGSVDPLFADFGAIRPIGTFPIDGVLTRENGGFAVDFPISGMGAPGKLTGRFTGPGAEELILTWKATLVIPFLTSTPLTFTLPAVAKAE